MSIDAWQSWEQILLRGYHVATASKDPSTQNAAVLVAQSPDRPGGGLPLDLTWAINSLPTGVVDSPERWEKPLKYAVVEHAERGTLHNAARYGIRTSGTALVTPWTPCAECARGLIQAGINTLVTHTVMNDATPEHWAANLQLARQILAESGVALVDIDTPLGGPTVRHTGQPLSP